MAVSNGHFEVVQYLVDNGAQIRARTNLSNTPLMLAAVKNHCDIINFLIQRGHPAQINSTTVGGNTALHNAAKKGCLEVVKCLVEQGADVDLKNKCKETPFDLANQNEQKDVIKYLLEKKKKTIKKKKIPLYNDKHKVARSVLAKVVDKSVCVKCSIPMKGLYVLNPCGHASLCGTCCFNISQENYSTCPICRKPIRDFTKLCLQEAQEVELTTV